MNRAAVPKISSIVEKMLSYSTDLKAPLSLVRPVADEIQHTTYRYLHNEQEEYEGNSLL